jgi:hypothetical protein
MAEQPAIQLPGHQLSVGQQEPMFPVSPRDWRRIRGGVERLHNPIPWAKDMMWAALGIAVSCVLGRLAWGPVYDQLPTSAQLQNTWQGPTLLVASIGAFTVVGICFFMNRSVEGELKKDAASILADMDSIHSGDDL